MIKTGVICPNCHYNISMGTQTEEVLASYSSFQICNFFSKNSLLYQDKKFQRMLISARNAKIFSHAEICLKFLNESSNITRQQMGYFSQLLNQLINIINEEKNDSEDYKRALFLQKNLLEKVIEFLKKKRKDI